MHPLLHLQHVNVTRATTPVLHDINLLIHLGEHIAILGPNGCGKSTLLKTITCELYPIAHAETKVEIFGRSRWDLTALRKRLGVVQADLPGKPMLSITGRDAVLTGFFSSSTLWPNLSVTPEMRDRAEATLALTAATPFAHRLFGELSAGQQRRILIARALVASHDCLLLDEPSNALDLAAQRSLRELLTTLAARGITLLHITHHVADIIPAIQRVILMQNGRITHDGPRNHLLTAGTLSALFSTPVHLTEHDGHYHAW